MIDLQQFHPFVEGLGLFIKPTSFVLRWATGYQDAPCYRRGDRDESLEPSLKVAQLMKEQSGDLADLGTRRPPH